MSLRRPCIKYSSVVHGRLASFEAARRSKTWIAALRTMWCGGTYAKLAIGPRAITSRQDQLLGRRCQPSRGLERKLRSTILDGLLTDERLQRECSS